MLNVMLSEGKRKTGNRILPKERDIHTKDMAKFKIKEYLTIGLPAASLGVSSANYITNKKRRDESNEFNRKQIKILNRLTNSLDKVDDTLKHNTPAPQVEEKKKKFLFFSNTGDLAYKGGILGGGLASGAGLFLPNKIGGEYKEGEWQDDPKFKHPKFREKYNKASDQGLRQILVSLGGVVVGATLGAIAGAVMDISEAVSRKTTVNARLMKDVLDVLKKSGYKEGKDYTRDPKKANLMKTKVCLVISRSGDSLRLLINTINDPKLKSLSSGIVKNLPAMSTVTEKASDRFNELNVTTMTTNNGDATWVGSVAERFISAGYPVYLVEVG